MTLEEAKRITVMLKALSHPARVIIVDNLKSKDMCGSDFFFFLKIDQSVISRHLSCLKNAGIVSEKKKGVKVYYHLETPCILNALRCALKAVYEDIRKKSSILKQK